MKHIKLFEQFISEKKSKSEYEDIIDKYESKIWELDNANASWIPTDSSKKEKMRQTFQKKIDAAQKALDKLDESLVNEARDITSVKRGDIIIHDETGKEYEVQDLIGKVHRLQSNKLRVVDMEGNVRVINPYKYSIKESLVNEARAPKTVDELKSALDDAYEKMNKYNEKYYSISKAPGGGSWSSNSKEGKAAAKYKKMANNQQANIWKWTDKLRKLGVEYISTNESLVNEGITSETEKVANELKKELVDMKKHFGSRLKANTIYWGGYKKVMKASERSEGLEPSRDGIIPMYLYWMSKYRADKSGKYNKLAKEIEKQGIKLQPLSDERDGTDNWKIIIN